MSVYVNVDFDAAEGVNVQTVRDLLRAAGGRVCGQIDAASHTMISAEFVATVEANQARNQLADLLESPRRLDVSDRPAAQLPMIATRVLEPAAYVDIEMPMTVAASIHDIGETVASVADRDFFSFGLYRMGYGQGTRVCGFRFTTGNREVIANVVDALRKAYPAASITTS